MKKVLWSQGQVKDVLLKYDMKVNTKLDTDLIDSYDIYLKYLGT